MMIHVYLNVVDSNNKNLQWNGHLKLGAPTRKSVALSVIIAAAKVSSSYQNRNINGSVEDFSKG